MTSNELVTKAIKVRLARLGITQLRLAEMSHINKNQLNRYMVGARDWPIRVLDNIAPALGWEDCVDIAKAAEKEKHALSLTDKQKNEHD